MISERLLKKWRRDALKEIAEIDSGSGRIIDKIGFTKTINERILRLTQELQDLILLKKGV